MKTLRLIKIIEKLGLALLIIGSLGVIFPDIEALTILVRCDKGQSVQSALDNLTGPVTIMVSGICKENLLIMKDDVTINGGTFVGLGSSKNAIEIKSARRV